MIFNGYNFNCFFEKSFNEKFAASAIKSIFGYSACNHGNDADVPDYLFDEKEWFEISLICDSRKRNNLVQRILHKNFVSEDVENELLIMIHERIEDKSRKKYINLHPNLCLICPVPMLDWIAPPSCLDALYTSERREFFDLLYSEYVETGIFKNVFILVPNVDSSWTLIDFNGMMLDFEGDINDPDYPYYFMQ